MLRKSIRRLKIHLYFIFIPFLIWGLVFNYPLSKAASADEGTIFKRTLAIMAFNPPINPAEADILKTAAKRVEKTKRFYLVKESETTALAARLFEEGDKGYLKIIDEAEAELARGKEFYDRLQFSDAIQTLSSSIKKYRKALPYMKDATNLLRALIYLGMAYISVNDLERGKNYIIDSLMIDPERKTRKLSESQFPPNIRSIYQVRQEAINKTRGGKVYVICYPLGSTLYINGFKVADIQGSAAVEDLPPGKHLMMIEKPGWSRFSQEVELGADDVTINAVLDRWSVFFPVAPERLDDNKKESLKGVAAELGADILLLGAVDSKDDGTYVASGQLFDSNGGDSSKIEEVRFKDPRDSSKSFSKAVSNLLKDSLTVENQVIPYTGVVSIAGTEQPIVPAEPMGDSPFKEKKQGSGSIFKKWWFWGIIGAAVVATGSVFLFTDAGKSDPTYNIVRVSR